MRIEVCVFGALARRDGGIVDAYCYVWTVCGVRAAKEGRGDGLYVVWNIGTA